MPLKKKEEEEEVNLVYLFLLKLQGVTFHVMF